MNSESRRVRGVLVSAAPSQAASSHLMFKLRMAGGGSPGRPSRRESEVQVRAVDAASRAAAAAACGQPECRGQSMPTTLTVGPRLPCPALSRILNFSVLLSTTSSKLLTRRRLASPSPSRPGFARIPKAEEMHFSISVFLGIFFLSIAHPTPSAAEGSYSSAFILRSSFFEEGTEVFLARECC